MENEIFFTLLKEGSTLLILGFFVWYFMKQLAERDKRLDVLQELFVNQERMMLTTIAANTEAFNKLCASIDNLKQSLASNYEHSKLHT